MPEPMERRQSPRARIRIPLLYRRIAPAPVISGVGWTHNLNETGACLEIADRFEAPTALRLLFQTDQGSLDLHAVVEWVAVIKTEGGGKLHGVTFLEVTSDQQQAILELLRSQG